jgi:hypothetical protein
MRVAALVRWSLMAAFIGIFCTSKWLMEEMNTNHDEHTDLDGGLSTKQLRPTHHGYLQTRSARSKRLESDDPIENMSKIDPLRITRHKEGKITPSFPTPLPRMSIQNDGYIGLLHGDAVRDSNINVWIHSTEAYTRNNTSAVANNMNVTPTYDMSVTPTYNNTVNNMSASLLHKPSAKTQHTQSETRHTQSESRYAQPETRIAPQGKYTHTTPMPYIASLRTNTRNHTCMPPAAFGSETEHPCFGPHLVKSITIRAPNCNDTCGGVRYTSKHPDANYTIEVFTDRAFDRVRNSTATCKLALLWEPPADSVGMYYFYYFTTDPHFSEPFHKVFTFSDRLIDSDHSKFVRYLSAEVWVRQDPILTMGSEYARRVADEYLYTAIRAKERGVSMILSHKNTAAGHKMRHLVWKDLGRKGLTGTRSLS